jgi:acetoacetate decarboxylase
MNESEVRRRAYAMPLTSPAYPVGPYRFCNREYMIITPKNFVGLCQNRSRSKGTW